MNTIIYTFLIIIFLFNIYSDMYDKKETVEKTDISKILNPIGFLLAVYLLVSLRCSKKGNFSM